MCIRDRQYPDANVNFMKQIYPQIKLRAQDSVKSVFNKINPNKKEQTFELFGLDFMIDDNFQVWLIEINTNPCLEFSAPLLAKIIPQLVDNALRIAVDPLFPPPQPEEWPYNKKFLVPDNIFENNKFDLFFDERVDGPKLKEVLQNSHNDMDEQQILQIIKEEHGDQEEEPNQKETDNQDSQNQIQIKNVVESKNQQQIQGELQTVQTQNKTQNPN
eukprot:TRINITY_DN14346_c0_g1_i1.p1 TRINITY_DN14346_c0_g1~~TRINITY_DN14346_c0_g1_i1.p1  ORF type:complete len:216 (+),score=50.20 TRINITY_DN14346_c0_g1_i1:107-754(+)